MQPIRRVLLLLFVSFLLASAGGVYGFSQQASAQDSPAPLPVAQVVSPTVSTSQAASSGRLEVHFIDVGQGDSIFIRTPDGHTALIDGGEGTGLALSYLQQQGITGLDRVIVSHPHSDHIGGLVQVLNAMPVNSVWTSGATHTTATYERLIDTIAERCHPLL